MKNLNKFKVYDSKQLFHERALDISWQELSHIQQERVE